MINQFASNLILSNWLNRIRVLRGGNGETRDSIIMIIALRMMGKMEAMLIMKLRFGFQFDQAAINH